MILFFSGTGNSAYAAKRIGNGIGDEAINLFERIRNHDNAAIHSDRPWVVVVPTYAWRIPRLVQHWLEHTELAGNRNIYFVMTCGDNIGNAGKYLRKLCAEKNLHYRGCAAVIMPENYSALFPTPTLTKALKTIHKAEGVIDQIVAYIRNGESLPQPVITFQDRITSGIVNGLFYPLFVHAKKFYATAACISCGKCVNVCPTKNIRLENGKPVWGKSCTHCMACICRCPKEAIEYGQHSRGLTRYVCPKA